MIGHNLPAQGLSYLAARELLGHEALVQADLLLKLAAGRALAAMAGVPPPGPGGYSMEVLAAVMTHQPPLQQQASRDAPGLGQGSGTGAGVQEGSSAGGRDGNVSLRSHMSHQQDQHQLMQHHSVQQQQQQQQQHVFPEALRARVAKVLPRVQQHLAAGSGGGAERTALEAVAWLRALLLSGRVAGGPAPFARLAGSVADEDLVQQATRCVCVVQWWWWW
jgi:hypothetical protein